MIQGILRVKGCLRCSRRSAGGIRIGKEGQEFPPHIYGNRHLGAHLGILRPNVNFAVQEALDMVFQELSVRVRGRRVFPFSISSTRIYSLQNDSATASLGRSPYRVHSIVQSDEYFLYCWTLLRMICDGSR